MIVGDIVTNNARLYPDKAGIVDRDVRFTWEQVDNRTNSLANAMTGLGLQKGDRVAIISENNHRYAEFLISVGKNGLIGVGLSYRFTPQQLTAVINDCQPRAILVQDKFASVINEVKPQVNSVNYIIGMGEGHGYPLDYEALLDEYPQDKVEGEVEADDIYLIIYTTGTTGAPKGVITTHRIWQSILLTRLLTYRLSADDVYLVHGPLYLAGGLQHFHTACLGGGTVVVVAFNAASFVELIEREKVTVSYLLPVHYKLIRDYLEESGSKHNLGSLKKLAFGAGQATSAQQVKDILGFFGVSWSNKLYGMTEGIVSFLMPWDIAAGLSPQATERERRRLDSVGKPVLNTWVRVVDENDEDVPPGETGEVLVKSDSWMVGYWNKPDLTRQAFRGGWYHTSDWGMLDEDGYLYLLGRKDFMVKTGGFNVFPGEVESAALTHPGIAEAAMFGVPDERWVNTVNLAVVLKPGYKVTEEEIMEHCRKRLAGYQTPKAVYLMDKLPTDPSSSKVLRVELREMFEKKSI